MTEFVTDVDDRAAELRDELVRSLRADDTITSPSVEAAFRAVPRHAFAPGVDLEHAYARHAVITKHDDQGRPTSSVSDPHIQAVMLEQAGVEPGMRVLEIGSGGYNAALLAELVGVDGRVTTVDIDPDVTSRAREFLDATGYGRVEVVTADAEEGVPAHAPYDRIVVTVGTWDIPPNWAAQLAPGGRMVVPLRTRGVTRSVVFDRDGDHLVSRGSAPCGFVAMQGVGEHQERQSSLGEGLALLVDDGGWDDPGLSEQSLAGERSAAWSGETIGRSEAFDHLFLRFATELPGFVRLWVDQAREDLGLVETGEKMFPFAAADKDALAYMVVRPAESTDRVELGARAFGGHGAEAAEAMAEVERVWSRVHRHGPGPVYRAYPANTPDDALAPGHVVDKRHSRVVISWPSRD